MAKKTASLLPYTRQLLAEFGERLKLARLRRKLTAKQVAERAGMSPMTLRSLEAGGSGVTIGAYISVMQVLGLERDLAKLGADDELGRQLQDSRLVKRSAVPPAQPITRKSPVDQNQGNSAAASKQGSGVSAKRTPSVRDNESRRGSSLVTDQGSVNAVRTTAADLASLLQPSKNRKESGKK